MATNLMNGLLDAKPDSIVRSTKGEQVSLGKLQGLLEETVLPLRSRLQR